MDLINTPMSRVTCPNVENPENQAVQFWAFKLEIPKTDRIGLRGYEKMYVGRLFSGYPLLGVLGAWMTFKNAEMAKTLRDGLSMIEMNPLNHNWLDFVI